MTVTTGIMRKTNKKAGEAKTSLFIQENLVLSCILVSLPDRNLGLLKEATWEGVRFAFLRFGFLVLKFRHSPVAPAIHPAVHFLALPYSPVIIPTRPTAISNDYVI